MRNDRFHSNKSERENAMLLLVHRCSHDLINITWKNPWKNCVPANHNIERVAEAAITGAEEPRAIRKRQMLDPMRPMPTTAVGENRSPSGPVMKEPPA